MFKTINLFSSDKEIVNPEVKDVSLIEGIITKAMAKVGTTKKKDLCKYLPDDKSQRMHHFTFESLCQKNPKVVEKLLNQYILEKENPEILPKKKRKTRNLIKPNRLKEYTEKLNNSHLLRIYDYALKQHDKEIIRLLNFDLSLKSCKINLIRSIKKNKIDDELWNNYSTILNYLNKTKECNV